MKKPGKPLPKKPEKPILKKTTLLIPEALWLQARVKALDERTNLRELLLEGLEMRLGAGKKPKGATAEDWIAFYARKAEEGKR
jgi:hypothetical protein